ncbi:U-box domain-containing protein 54 [Linum perenne]
MEFEGQSSSFQYKKSRVMSSEIVEIVDLEENNNSSRSGIVDDVYVCVGKRDDIDAVKWAVDHISIPSRLFLVHVFPPIRYISTPVGRLAKTQLSKEQMRYYDKEENNMRRNLLHKYIRLCDDAKVPVDTVLVESNETVKAIIDLIPVLNITNLVLGTNLPPRSRRLMKKVGKAEFVKKNAPDYCHVTIVRQGKAVTSSSSSSTRVQRMASIANPDRNFNFFPCACFSRGN